MEREDIEEAVSIGSRCERDEVKAKAKARERGRERESREGD